MEASALPAPAGLTRSRTSIGASLLRLRTDEQLVALFRAGHDEAFCAIHDRYRQRLFAYTRQMLPASRQDAEDALQDTFVRAYAGLRANHRELALRAWLYRVAHNRCIDELRRPPAPAPEVLELVRSPIQDPVAQAEQREVLRRLIADVRRLPEQQRSALLMRELGGMSYRELAEALGVSVPAVKSLLVRARGGISQSLHARETACSAIRNELVLAHDRGVRPNATARRHLRDCSGCRQFRHEVRGASRRLAALAPAFGPFGLLAKLLGLGLGGGSGGSVAAGGGAVAAGGIAGTGGAVATGGVLGAVSGTHIAALLAAAALTAGGAVEVQHSISAAAPHRAGHGANAAAGASKPGRSVGKSDLGSVMGSASSIRSTASRQVALTSPRFSRGTGNAGGPRSTPATKPPPLRTSSSPADFIGAAGQLVGPGSAGSTTATPLGDSSATFGASSSANGAAGPAPGPGGAGSSPQSDSALTPNLLSNPSGAGHQSPPPSSGSATRGG